jgi:integrase
MAIKQAKQRVKLRTRITSDNSEALLLDWSKDNKRKREFINLHLFIKPTSVFEKQHNKEVSHKAELIRAERERQFFADEIDEIVESKKLKESDFTAYFENYVTNYTKKDLRVMRAVLNLYKDFAPPHITAKNINDNHCTKFLDYLNTNLNGETPSSYFARFKKVIRQATKDKLFRVNPTTDIRAAKPKDNIEKDVLTIEELKLLVDARCGNEEVKRAFLFACNTGLRWVDIGALQWKHVRADEVKMKQAKTDNTVEVKLNNNAKNFLGKRGEAESHVFALPTHTAALGNLRRWVKRAGIEKHITFHCARHSFGTLLAYYDNDIQIISKLLGHTSMKHTTKYVRVAKALKEKAVNSIPNY